MEVGGNQKWFGFTNEYLFTAEPIERKYIRTESKWYKRRLARTAMGQPFSEVPPPHDVKEAATTYAKKTEDFVSKLFK